MAISMKLYLSAKDAFRCVKLHALIMLSKLLGCNENSMKNELKCEAENGEMFIKTFSLNDDGSSIVRSDNARNY